MIVAAQGGPETPAGPIWREDETASTGENGHWT